MGDDLVTVEVEIDPMFGASALGAAEQIAIEAARGVEVVDRKGEMEGWRVHGAALLWPPAIVEAFVKSP
jgi:hypothetical protein